MTYKDSLALSWKNVKGNKLRTAITVIIIALGIFALILIITAIKAASNRLTTSFSTMGANAFSIRFQGTEYPIRRWPRSGTKKTKTGQEKKIPTWVFPSVMMRQAYLKNDIIFPEPK